MTDGDTKRIGLLPNSGFAPFHQPCDLRHRSLLARVLLQHLLHSNPAGNVKPSEAEPHTASVSCQDAERHVCVAGVLIGAAVVLVSSGYI